jgi:hypothetical protein
MRYLAAVAVLVIMAPTPARAQAKMDPDLLARFNAYVSAIHAKDVQKIVTFINPGDRAEALKYYSDAASMFADS